MVLSHLTAITVLIFLPLKHLGAIEMKEVKLGEMVSINCNLSFFNEIYWLKMSAEGQPTSLMVTIVKHNGNLSTVWNSKPTHFEGFMKEQSTGLKILNVSTNDLATYFCATFKGKEMNFGKGVKIYTNQRDRKEKEQQVQGFVGLSLHYQVFAAVLSFGILAMFLAVSVVHMKTRTKENDKNRHFHSLFPAGGTIFLFPSGQDQSHNSESS